MPGVPRELAEHTLNIDPKFKPVRQFLCCFNKERRKAIGEEVARLLAAGFIVEVFHPKWLANPVLVLKKNGTWHIRRFPCKDVPVLTYELDECAFLFRIQVSADAELPG